MIWFLLDLLALALIGKLGYEMGGVEQMVFCEVAALGTVGGFWIIYKLTPSD